MGGIRVAIVEDNDGFRETLALLLELQPDIQVAGTYAGGAEALEACEELAPDVALVDYRMPGLDGAQTTRALLDRLPSVRVVCLTASIAHDEVGRVLDAGAVACVTKDTSLDRIVAAIRDAAAAPVAAGRAGRA